MSKPPTSQRDIEGAAADGGEKNKLPICGIVRPIATMGEAYPETHWLEVHEIVAEAARAAGYRLRLVSESDQVGIIVSEIIRNLHENPIVVIDVSGRNPNVMFELGMRVTFQKPVVVITDDNTPFTFDIQAIRHISYRRDLRTGPTRLFQRDLTAAILATVEAASKPGYKGYLQQFGRIEVTDLADQTVSLTELAQAVQDLKGEVRSVARQNRPRPSSNSSRGSSSIPKMDGTLIKFQGDQTERWRSLVSSKGWMFSEHNLANNVVAFFLPGVKSEHLEDVFELAAELGLSYSVEDT